MSGIEISSFADIDNKGKDVLILGKEITQELDDTTLTVEAIYPINFTQSNKRFVLWLYYNGSNSFLFVNTTKAYQFKAKIFEIKRYALCLGNILKDFTIENMNKTGLKVVVKFFSVDFNAIDTNEILDIHKYSMKKTRYKKCLVSFKKCLWGY